MTEWYYRRNGKEFGPFPPKQFKQMASEGVVQPHDEIRRDRGEWVSGSRIEGLFPAVPVPRPMDPSQKLAGKVAARRPATRNPQTWIAAGAIALAVLILLIVVLLKY